MSVSTTPNTEGAPIGYAEFMTDLKSRVRATQFRAARAANTEVLRLYWSIGRDLIERRAREAWGTKILARLAADLQREFPDQRGWSERNLRYMRAMAEAWPDESIWQRPVARLPWGHVTVLLSRLNVVEDRNRYAECAVAQGWSRSVLEHHIRMGLRRALGKAPSNFATALGAPDSDLAQQLLRDPYVFEHLTLVSRKDERMVEQALMDRLQDTLLEFGRGMAFIGHVGQLGTYVAIVDDLYRNAAIHGPTVGVLLCTGKSGPAVRYALASAASPVAVADYYGLPDDARAALPSATELQAVITDEIARIGS